MSSQDDGLNARAVWSFAWNLLVTVNHVVASDEATDVLPIIIKIVINHVIIHFLHFQILHVVPRSGGAEPDVSNHILDGLGTTPAQD